MNQNTEPPGIPSGEAFGSHTISIRRPEDEGTVWVATKPTAEAPPVLEDIIHRIRERIVAHAVARSRDRGVATTDESDVRYGYDRFVQADVEKKTRKPRIWRIVFSVAGTLGGAVFVGSFSVSPKEGQVYWIITGVVLVGSLVVREILDNVLPQR